MYCEIVFKNSETNSAEGLHPLPRQTFPYGIFKAPQFWAKVCQPLCQISI